MSKKIRITLAIVLVIALLTSCFRQSPEQSDSSAQLTSQSLETQLKGNPGLSFHIIAETLTLELKKNDDVYPIFEGYEKKHTETVKDSDIETVFQYPNEKMQISVKKETDYLSLNIKSLSEEHAEFSFPLIKADAYILPIGEGKYISADSPDWKTFLKDDELSTIESLSMAFLAFEQNGAGIVMILENNFNNTIRFDTKNNIALSLSHAFPAMNPNKELTLRIYMTDNNPVSIAKIYRNYIEEQGHFLTLEQKAAENPNIKKLYGAPHIYLWDEMVISEPDVNWNAFRNQLDSHTFRYIYEFILKNNEDSSGFSEVISQIRGQNYVDKYQQNLICQAVSRALLSRDFYSDTAFTQLDEKAKALLDIGIGNLTETQYIELNKHLLYTGMNGVFAEPNTWANDRTVGLISELHNAGVETAWLGLHSWTQGFIKPELVHYATEQGYLIGPYDSYHSIHKPGEEQWVTAAFPDTTLYENAVIMGKNNEFAKGFQGLGRKLSPPLSLPAVQQRLERLMANNVPFNTWFIDCDATGEIYDDYSPEHITTASEDLAARLERMAYIRDRYSMVIGSEGGNDFAAETIAFAHGIELPAFSWMDPDMNKNKESRYYTGRYYAPKGGVAEKFAKPVPLKEEYYKEFLDPAYNVPLFKLVYNESIITSNHWEWSNLKIEDNIQNRFVYNILYNVPPMYHLDIYLWETNHDIMLEQIKFYSDFSKQVINLEMTGFEVLSEDRHLQSTEFGDGTVKVIANFSNNVKTYEDITIKPNSVIVVNNVGQVSYPN